MAFAFVLPLAALALALAATWRLTRGAVRGPEVGHELRGIRVFSYLCVLSDVFALGPLPLAACFLVCSVIFGCASI